MFTRVRLFIQYTSIGQFLPLQMFCNLMNKDQLINNNQYSVVGGHKLIFLKMDPKYSKKIQYLL